MVDKGVVLQEMMGQIFGRNEFPKVHGAQNPHFTPVSFFL
jgi:hypothetical protein